MPPVSHLIKVLNGPHTGAQSGLGEGDELLVGNSPEADIILADPHILAHHCRITISDGNASVTPADGEVLVDGSPVSGTFRLGPEKVVTLGSTSFVVGPREGAWPAVSIPSQKQVSSASRRGKEGGEAPSSGSPLRILLPALLILSLVIFVASVITATGSRKPANPEYPGAVAAHIEKSVDELSTKSLESLAEGLEKQMPGLTILRKNTPPHGELVVLAPDEETSLRIRRDVASTRRTPVFVQVVNLDEVNKVLADILRERRQGVEVTIQPDGSLLWKGYLQSRKDLEAITARVRQDLPFLGADHDQIMYGDVLTPEVNAMLASSGLSPGIVGKADKEDLLLEGSFPPEKTEQWKSFEKKIFARFPGLKIEEKVNSAEGGHEIEKILGGHIAGITFGKSAWIELANGIRLFPGTRLANGMTLLSLSENEVTLQTADGILRVPLTGVMPQPASH